MKIALLTLNPAYDVHYFVPHFSVHSENYVVSSNTDCGGKGINIARALENLGIYATAFTVLGKDNCQDFEKELTKSIKNNVFFYTDGKIRENITIHEQSGKETRISLDNFSLSKAVFSEFKKSVLAFTDDETIVAFAGRIPKGIEKSEVIDFLLELKSKGSYIVCDSNSFDKNDLKKINPWLIKPNEKEIMDLTESKDFFESATALSKISSNVLVTLGADGAVFASDDGLYTADVPSVIPVSTIGAGDSTIAGFIYSKANNFGTEDSIRFSLACGTAACLEEGTNPPRKEEIDKIFNRITIKKLQLKS